MNNCNYDEMIKLALEKFLEISTYDGWIKSPLFYGSCCLYSHHHTKFCVSIMSYSSSLIKLNDLTILEIPQIPQEEKNNPKYDVYLNAIKNIDYMIKQERNQRECEELSEGLAKVNNFINKNSNVLGNKNE